jgi:hypothetical protein
MPRRAGERGLPRRMTTWQDAVSDHLHVRVLFEQGSSFRFVHL